MRLLRFLIDLLQLIDSTEIHILPLLNADGAAQSKDGCDSQAGRSNANNVDLDKNFPGTACSTQSTYSLKLFFKVT